MSNILITGVNGFTGRYLAERLAGMGHRVSGLLLEPVDEILPGVAHSYIGDLTDSARMRAVLAEAQPDHVVHLAAIAFVAHGDVEEMYRSNIIGTRMLLGALEDMACKPRSVLVASSANIYGNGRAGMIDETMPPAPANDYGVTKTAVELVCALAKLPVIVTRPFNYTGVGQSNSFLIPKIIDHVRRGAAEIELGNMDIARDFSDVRMVVDAYARLLDAPAAIGGTFNVCSGHATSLHDLIDAVRTVSGHDFTVRTNPAFVRQDEVKALCGSTARIESVIGPLSHIPLSDSLRWMLTA